MAAIMIFWFLCHFVIFFFFGVSLNHCQLCKKVDRHWPGGHKHLLPPAMYLIVQGHVICSTNVRLCVLNAVTRAEDNVFQEEMPNHSLCVPPCRQSLHFQSPSFSVNKDWNRWLLWEPYVIQSCVSVSESECVCMCQSGGKQLLTIDVHTGRIDLHNQCTPRADYQLIIIVFYLKKKKTANVSTFASVITAHQGSTVFFAFRQNTVEE